MKPIYEIKQEVTELLSALIQIDTTNPPGNETVAAEYLAKDLGKEGLECEIYESAPARGSLITRMKGTGEKPSLLLLSHLDVVAADKREWSVDPFGGTLKDGFVWGRGTLDMKGMTAIEAMVLKMLIRNGFKPRGDIILAATADEEAGGAAGAEYLLNHYPEKVLANYVLNEGGGSTIAVGGKRVFTVNTAEKGLLWLRVKAKGTPGHGSVPDVADNAILRINKIVERLGNFRGEFHIVPTMRRFLKAIAEADIGLQEPLEKIQADPNQTNVVLKELEKTAPTLADEIRPRMQITITPTIISGGVKENVIPSECMAVFDCRVLPGETIAQTQELIQRLLYDMELDKLSFEVIQEQEPSESPVETPLFGVIHDVLKDFEPDCRIAPSLTTGGTDSRFFRRKGSVCYGFHPLLIETKQDEKATRREHGIDERISVENLVFGASVLYETVRRFMS